MHIAADARMQGIDIADDQIWSLSLAGGDPAAMALETTYGRRALGMRLFSSIGFEGERVLDPAAFDQPPRVHTIYPNYLQVYASPFPRLQLRQEYWVHDSHAVLGRIEVLNWRDEPAALDLRLHALLRPDVAGAPFSPVQIDGVHVLTSGLARLAPLIFLEGGAETPPSAFPSLGVHATVGAGRSRVWQWAHVAERDHRSSFDRARRLCALPWEASVARIDMLNAGLVEVETGDPEWDAAFWLAQLAGLQAYVGPIRQTQGPMLVGRRMPADGYSASGDGGDYNGAWGGVDAAASVQIGRQVLHAAPDLVAGELRSRLRSQNRHGAIDGRPGVGGQRSQWESMPLLADMALRIHARTGDRTLLAEVYPALLQLLRSWFEEVRDVDADGYPEWRYLPQSGYGSWPAHVGWARWGQGLDLARVERPDLAAYLYRDCRALDEIARFIGETRQLAWIDSRSEALRRELDQSWDDKLSIYLSRDRDLNRPLQGERLGRGKGVFKLAIDRSFEHPIRVHIRCFGDETQARSLKVTVRGKGVNNRKMVERIPSSGFQWFWKMGTGTAERAANALESVEVEGLDPSFTTEVWLADTSQQDVSGLLPLWAGMVERKRAKKMVTQTLLDERRFWRAHGVPTVSAREPGYTPEKEGHPGAVWMFSNSLLGEALLEHGFRKEAAVLVSRLMSAVISGLRRDHEFSALYHPDAGQPLGECGMIEGLAPLDLFLATLGLQLIDPGRVRVDPGNPYPWPVMVRWRGLQVQFSGDQVEVIFPDGGSARVRGEGRRWVEQDRK